VHKRSAERLLLRRIRSTIFSTCFYDKDRREIVSRVTRQDLLSLVSEPVEVGLFPDVEKGEVLVDYRSHRIAAPRKIFCLKRDNELCGVIVYCYPPSTSFGRRLVLPNMPMRELNKKLSSISRVVVHPKYRTIGLGSKLVKETLHLAGTEYVEMSAVMAKYNPFAEKAGMRKVAEQLPAKETLKIVETIKNLGLNPELLGSTDYVLNIIRSLKEEDVGKIRDAFIKNNHTRFMKSFSYHLPFSSKEAYRKEIAKASLEKLVHLIKICGFLLQTKVYLYWSKKQNHTQ
jgi:GNAT superfamily N-acetyltransferase